MLAKSDGRRRQNVRSGGLEAALLSALIIASIVALAIPLLSTGTVHAALTSHATIYINGNGGFTKPDPVNGGGSGTKNDPYIIENWVITPWSSTGISINNTTAYFIIRNCIVENGGEGGYPVYGIFFYKVTNGKIVNNTVDTNGYNIRLENSDNNTLENNSIVETIYPGYGSGILLEYSNNNTLSNNAAWNGSSGIALSYFSENNTLINNTVVSNAYGIQLYDSANNNTLINNTCENNYCGIQLFTSVHTSADNNRVYHNNLVNNQVQDTGSNYWDNGYPSGGNYWSYYHGSDNYHGPNQNILGSDGIGDTPENIPGGSNQDRYPLMNPGSPGYVRGVSVSISPSSNRGADNTTLTYTVTVTNTGSVSDNYSLTVSDNASPSWSPSLDNTILRGVAPSANKSTILRVTVPSSAVAGAIDNIRVTVTSQADNTVHDNASCIAYAGTASLGLATSGTPPYLWGIRKANVTVNLTVNTGDNLHLIFLQYDNKTVEWDTVIWSRTAPGPQTVTLTNLVVQHPGNLNVKRVKLVLTDNAGNVVLDNMAWYTVVQSDWGSRIIWIVVNWANHTSSQQNQLGNEIIQIVVNWANVPTTSDQSDFSQS
jgi:parallel beta-helix repeat protein